ncbi:MAG: alpha/beta hydrolase [Christensenellaceae bacterium]|nr:alpha/beta hydrolase [Christensenellaceae bacterium]
MSDKSFLNWIIKPHVSADQAEAEALDSTRNWIEVAKEVRTKEWAEMLDSMEPNYLWENGAPNFDPSYGQRQPALYVYPEQNKDLQPRGAIIISAGGGYMFKSVWEAEPMARRFYEAGFQTFIIDYRVQPYSMEDSKNDMLRAVKYVRYYAEKFNIKPDKIAALGGSAGGMQSSFAATSFDYGIADSDDPIERVSSRADAIIYNYAAFTRVGLVAGAGTFSFEAQKERAKYSADVNLRHDSPPFFVWQTVADDPRNACNFCARLTEYGIPFELHIFPEGPHGCGLADGGHRFAPYCRSTVRWSQMAIEFLEKLEFLK